MPDETIAELAPIKAIAKAKINLTLHVGRIIEDPEDAFFGYHPLDSLVGFADVFDGLTVRPADKTSLTIDGPFGAGLDTVDNNLILKAYKAVAEKAPLLPLHITLTKNLPVASGIGGGSADAAAMLRLLQGFADLPDDVWHEIALGLGADVPVCLLSKTTHMSGIGEDLRPCPSLGYVPCVLVNPGRAVSTGAIFKTFDAGEVRETPRPQLASGSLMARAKDGRNDLEPPAIATEPVIQTVLDILESQSGCDLARMSGSGATCFGLFHSQKSADVAAEVILKNNPDWWVVATTIGDT